MTTTIASTVRYHLACAIIVTGFSAPSTGSPNIDDWSQLSFLTKDPPGLTPTVFAPGIVCTHMDDWAIRVSPDGNELYFTVTGKNQAALVSMKFHEGTWTGPEVMPFSGQHFDYAPAVSYDGTRLVFGAYRPSVAEEDDPDADLWIAHRQGEEWGTPTPLSDLNTEGTNETWPCFASNGDVYFASNRDGGHGSFDIYVSRYRDGMYRYPENVGPPVNSELGEYCPFISPDDSYLIIEIVDKPGGFGGGDMYVCLKQADGSWGEPRNMGEVVNSSRNDCYPCLSPDGQYFFFMSDRRRRTPRASEVRLDYRDILENAQKTGGWDIYWLQADALKPLLKR